MDAESGRYPRSCPAGRGATGSVAAIGRLLAGLRSGCAGWRSLIREAMAEETFSTNTLVRLPGPRFSSIGSRLTMLSERKYFPYPRATITPLSILIVAPDFSWVMSIGQRHKPLAVGRSRSARPTFQLWRGLPTPPPLPTEGLRCGDGSRRPAVAASAGSADLRRGVLHWLHRPAACATYFFAFFLRVFAAFLAEAEAPGRGGQRGSAALLPPFLAGALLTLLPRPEPLFLPPPVERVHGRPVAGFRLLFWTCPSFVALRDVFRLPLLLVGVSDLSPFAMSVPLRLCQWANAQRTLSPLMQRFNKKPDRAARRIGGDNARM